MKRLVLVGLMALCFPASALATTGQITGPSITDDGATVSAQDLSVDLDTGCGNNGISVQVCGGLAGVMPDSGVACPAPVSGLPAGLTTLWETDLASDRYVPWSTNSGPVSVQVTPAHAYRICLYARYRTDSGIKSVTPVASAVVTSKFVAPDDPPGGGPGPGDDAACAQAQAKLDKAKAKLRKLRRNGAKPKTIKRAKEKVRSAKSAVEAACA